MTKLSYYYDDGCRTVWMVERLAKPDNNGCQYYCELVSPATLSQKLRFTTLEKFRQFRLDLVNHIRARRERYKLDLKRDHQGITF